MSAIDVIMTRRQYYICEAIIAGADVFTAVEAVSSTAIEHPEWDMDEERTWADWNASNATLADHCPCCAHRIGIGEQPCGGPDCPCSIERSGK